jgi:hypothetical protein
MLMSCPFCGAGTDLPHETPAFAEASAQLTPNDISGDNPNPQPGRDNHGESAFPVG